MRGRKCADTKQYSKRARRAALQEARHCLVQQRKGQDSGSAALAREQQAVQRPGGLSSRLRQRAGGEAREGAGAAGAAGLSL